MEQNFNNLLWNEDSNDFLEEMEALVADADNLMSSSSSSSSDESGNESNTNEPDEEYVDFAAILDKYNCVQFKAHMRIKPSTAQYLTDRFALSQYIPENSHGGGRDRVSAKKSIFMYIWYISNTITFRQLAVLFNVAISTAWLVVNRVSGFLISIGHEYIKWPRGAEISTIQRKFEQKKRIPGIIGAIDCTHILIKAPTAEKDKYCDRKKDYSLVLQAVVDTDKKFLDICCGEPGSLHDFRVLRRSNLYDRAQSNVNELFPYNSFIIGDSAYPPLRWIVPPFKNYGNLTERQTQFNYIHSATRMVVENAFGLLKTRFRRLLKFTEQTNLPQITNIIASACVLHNICIIMDDLHESNEEHIVENRNEGDFEEVEFLEGANRRDLLFSHLIEQNII